jgi:hypothetical protein
LVLFLSRKAEIPTAEKGTNTGANFTQGARVKQNFAIGCQKAFAVFGNLFFPRDKPGLYKTYPKNGVAYTQKMKRQYPKNETRRL